MLHYILQFINEKSTAVLTIAKTEGEFPGFIKEKTTELHVNVSEDVDSITARIGDRDVTLTRVDSLDTYEKGRNVYFYHKDPKMATYNPNSEAIQNLSVSMNDLIKIKLEKTDVSQSDIVVTVNGFVNKEDDKEIPEGLVIPDIPTNLSAPEAFITATELKVTWSGVEKAESYDLLHNDVLYSNIKGEEFSFEDLPYGSTHTFKVRAVNAKGVSDWSDTLNTKTSEDPWMNAIDIDPAKVLTNIKPQPGQGIDNLFNKKTGDIFHSDWNSQVTDDSYIRIDLGGIYELDYLEYLQRDDGGVNGRVQWATFWTSQDGTNWTQSGSEDWRGDGTSKKHSLNTKARYLHMNVDDSYGKFISGQELLVFKKPGTKVSVLGDINNDGVITEDDKTSFLNYTGLRNSDSDFDYIKHVDSNKNGLIDAQDINIIATQLNGGVQNPQTENPSGRVYLTADKLNLKAGETSIVTLMADELANVNALTSTFRIDASKLTVVDQKVRENADFTKAAENFSNVKTRQGQTDVVFTFVNFGQQELMSGSGKVATVTLRANEDTSLDFSSNEGVLVGNNQASTKIDNLPVRQEVTYTDKPAIPSDLSSSRQTQGSVTLSWNKNPQALRYIVEKEVVAEDGSKSYVEVARVEQNTADIYNLLPETDYTFRVKAINPIGSSEASQSLTTSTVAKDRSKRLNVKDVAAGVPSQPGQELELFVDGDEDTQYHSQWHNDKAVPSVLLIELDDVKEVDHLVYVPRQDAGNGTITSLTLQTSTDGETWSVASPIIRWNRTAQDKVALLPLGTKAKYIKVDWLSSAGGYVSGQELYVIASDPVVEIPESTEEVAKDVMFTHEGTGVVVTLTAKESEIAGLALVVVPNVSLSDVADSIDESLRSRDLDIFDIHFVNETGQEVPLRKSMRVLLSKDVDKEVEAVYYIDPTLEDQSLAFEVLADNMVAINVDHFSHYAIVYRDQVSETQPKPTPESETDKPISPTPESETDKPVPPTPDQEMPMIPEMELLSPIKPTPHSDQGVELLSLSTPTSHSVTMSAPASSSEMTASVTSDVNHMKPTSTDSEDLPKTGTASSNALTVLGLLSLASSALIVARKHRDE